jgi:hypothetical protein
MRLLWRNAGFVASFDHKLTTDFRSQTKAAQQGKTDHSPLSLSIRYAVTYRMFTAPDP